MIKAIIIGSKSINRLHQLLIDNFEDVIVVGKAMNVSAGVDLIKKKHSDVIFLEILLGKESCFDILKYFDCDQLNLIFISSNHHSAIKAIKFSALDYLIRPINLEELQSAILKLRNNRLKIRNKFGILSSPRTNQSEQQRQIIIPKRDYQIIIKLHNIIRIEAKGSYVLIFQEENKSHIVVNTLKYYENLLPSDKFYRIHKSHLINVYKIKRIAYGRSSKVLLMDGSELNIAARRKSAFSRFVKQIV